MTMGQRIRDLRKAARPLPGGAGLQAGVKKAAIHKYESGLVVNLKQITIEKLAAALHTTPAYLLGLETASLPEGALPYHPTQRIPILEQILPACPSMLSRTSRAIP